MFIAEKKSQIIMSQFHFFWSVALLTLISLSFGDDKVVTLVDSSAELDSIILNCVLGPPKPCFGKISNDSSAEFVFVTDERNISNYLNGNYSKLPGFEEFSISSPAVYVHSNNDSQTPEVAMLVVMNNSESISTSVSPTEGSTTFPALDIRESTSTVVPSEILPSSTANENFSTNSSAENVPRPPIVSSGSPKPATDPLNPLEEIRRLLSVLRKQAHTVSSGAFLTFFQLGLNQQEYLAYLRKRVAEITQG